MPPFRMRLSLGLALWLLAGQAKAFAPSRTIRPALPRSMTRVLHGGEADGRRLGSAAGRALALVPPAARVSRRSVMLRAQEENTDDNDKKKLDKDKQIQEIANKMRKADWWWPLTEWVTKTDWDEMEKKGIETPPLELLSGLVSLPTYLRAAAYIAASFASYQAAEGLADISKWSYVAAACTGFFGVSVIRQFLLLKTQSDLIEELRQADDPDELVRQALQVLELKRRGFDVSPERKAEMDRIIRMLQEEELGIDKMRKDMEKEDLEWDPDGLLPPQEKEGPKVSIRELAQMGGDDDSGDPVGAAGLLAGVDKRRGETAARRLRDQLVMQVRESANSAKPETGSALGTLSSLDSFMSQYSGAEGVSPESLSVSEERFDAAEKIFRRFDENDSGTLYAGELRELARAYDLLLPGDGELTYFVEALGGTSEGSPKVTKDAFLTFWAAAEKGEAVSSEKKQKSESEALVKD